MTFSFQRRALLPLAAFGLLLGARGIAQAQENGPTAPVMILHDGLLAIMKAGRSTPFEQRMNMLIPVVQRAFALREVVRTVVGFRYASFTPPQQQQLLQAFTRFTAASYVANFDSYDGETFEISPTLRRAGNDEVVSTTFVSKTDRTRFDYVVRQTGAGYQIVDVLLDGSISRVAVQRSDFRSVLSSNDPSALITELQNKVTSLAAGNKG